MTYLINGLWLLVPTAIALFTTLLYLAGRANRDHLRTSAENAHFDAATLRDSLEKKLREITDLKAKCDEWQNKYLDEGEKLEAAKSMLQATNENFEHAAKLASDYHDLIAMPRRKRDALVKELRAKV